MRKNETKKKLSCGGVRAAFGEFYPFSQIGGAGTLQTHGINIPQCALGAEGQQLRAIGNRP